MPNQLNPEPDIHAPFPTPQVLPLFHLRAVARLVTDLTGRRAAHGIIFHDAA
jgi:hypothetical protein